MKPHLPTALRSALFSCFAAVSVCSTSLFTATLSVGLCVYASMAPSAYAAYNAQSYTFEGTDNAAINPTSATYDGIEMLIFNMGTAGTGNHLSNASWTYAGNIQIGAEGATTTGLCLNNGNSSKVNVFTGKVTGSGLLSKTGAGRNLTVAFEGDVTEFTGDIRLASTVPFTLRFGAGGNAVAGATAAHGVSGTGDIYFEGSTYDTVIYNFAANAPVYITNCIHTAAGATSRVELNGGGAYVLTKDAVVSQLSLGGTSTLQIGTEDMRSEIVLGSLMMEEGAAVSVENGKLTLSGAAPLVGRFEVGAHGVLQLEHTTTLNGALTVAEGGALAVGPIAGFDTDADAYDVPADGTNGFAAVNGKLALLEGEDELLQALAGTDVIFGGQRLKLAADGTVMLSDSDYTVYYLRHGEASLAALMEESHQLMTSVQVSAGAKLAVETGAVQGAFSYGESRVLGVNGVEPTMTGETHVEHLLATTALTVGNGATLTIGSTAEGNAADININTNGHLVFAAAEPTEMSVGSINNNGDLRNNFERTVLVEEGVTLHAASFINSWGMKSLTVNGELVVEDVLGYSTGSNSAGTNLLTGTGTVTVGELNIGNVSTSNTFDVRSLHVLGNANIGSNATISGGTVTIDGSVTMVPTVSKHTSFVLTVAGGHLILGDDVSDTVTLNHSLNISGGSLTLNGTAEISSTLTQTGGSITNNGSITVSGALSVSSTWDNTSGSINFNPGAVLNLTDLTGLEGMSGYTEGENGFIQAGSITVFRGGSITGVENVTVNNGAQGAVLTENGSVVLLGSESGINQYFLNVGSKTLSSIVSAANGNLGGIRVKAGTTLVVDEGEVMGRWTFGADRTIDSETPISLVSGDTHVDNLLSTAALTVGNGATLTIGSTAEGNAADININANGHLVFAAAEPTEMSVGTIRNNGDQRNNYDRTVLVEEGVNLHAVSFLNSWGLKSLTVNGELDIEGTLYYSTGSNSAGTNLLTGTGTVTAGELNIGNVSTSNTFDVRSLHVLGNANIGSNATISDGTVTIDGSLTMEPTSVYVTSLVLTVDGGHLILGDDESDTAVFGGIVNLSSGSLTINGTATDDNHLQQTGGVLNINGALKLNSPLTSSGTINLNGSLQVNSADMAPIGEVTYSEGRNGYKTASYILLNKGGDDFRFVCGEGSAVLLDGANVSDRLTTDASGNIILTSATGRIYYVNEGTAVFGGDNSTIDTERAVGVALNGGNLTLNVDSGKNCELNLFSAAVVTLGGGCTLNSADVTGTQYLTLDGSGTYIVSTPAGVTDIHYAASWSGDTLVQAHLDNAENNELALNNQAYLGFSATPGSVDGGAMSNVGVLTMNDNGEVSFLHNSVTAAGRVYGGAIDNRNRLSLSANGNVSFEDNSAVSGESYALGGAIYNNVDVFTLTDNENVSFIGNTVQAQDSAVGGAICNNNSGSFVISGNQNITFTDNATHSIGGQGNGGAISSSYNFALSDNGTVIFGGNSANSYGGAVFASNNFALSANESVIFEGNSVGIRGGAIYVSSSGVFEMNDNESVIFENNSAGNLENAGYGAAIDCGGIMTVEGNGFLAFRNNSIAGTTSGAYGAAIRNGNTLSMRENSSIVFSGNTAVSGESYARGGAMYNESLAAISMTDNGDISFADNFVRSEHYIAYGGALYNGNELSLSGNQNITFSHNTVESGRAAQDTKFAVAGGAVLNSGTLHIDDNADVSFIGNRISTENAAAGGGAIFMGGGSTLSLCGNGAVVFRENTAVSENGPARGGAIDAMDSTVKLSGNGDVLFERNAEIENGAYRLRSIFSDGVLELSATEGHSINFMDSIRVSGAVSLNAEGTGDIVFTGATTEDDLLAVKGSAGTEEEVLNSRTSELLSEATLYGGRLYVEHGAVLRGGGLTVAEGAHSTIVLTHAALDESGHDITISSGSGIQFVGANNELSADCVTLADGAFLCFVLTDENSIVRWNADLTLQGNLDVAIDDRYYIPDGEPEYALLTMQEGNNVTGWNTDTVTLNGAASEYLVWENGTLYYRPFSTPVIEGPMEWTLAKGVWTSGGSFGDTVFEDGDDVCFRTPANVTISGEVMPGEMLVAGTGNITFTVDKKVPESGISGSGTLTKEGESSLTLNAGNTYSGGTVLNGGTIKVTAADSLGDGTVTINGGTLDLGGQAVANDIVLSGEALIKGDAKYEGSVTVEGDATLLGKTSYKGTTTIDVDSTLTLADSVTIAGDIVVDGGVLNIRHPKGLNLAKGTSLMLEFGSVNGLLNVGAGSTLVWSYGDFTADAPVLNGGTVDLGGNSELVLVGSNAAVQFGDKAISLLGKGSVLTYEALTVKNGTVSVTAMDDFYGDFVAESGTLKLATGKVAVDNTIYVTGNAAVVNGTAHYGDIVVDGTLTKETSIKLLTEEQCVTLNGSGEMLGTISGTGLVVVNGDVDITAATLANANIRLAGTLTHTKGWTLAKGQTLTLDGGSVNGTLTVGAGSVLVVNGQSMDAVPVLKGGTVDFGGGSTMSLTGDKALISLENQQLSLLGKSMVNSDSSLIVCGGSVSVNDFGDNDATVEVQSGTLKLVTGKAISNNTIYITGNAAVVNGATHYGDIIVDGTLTKETSIKLLAEDQRVELNGSGAMLGTVSGAGVVAVSGDVDITDAKLSNANVLLSGTVTHKKGWTLAKDQTLTLDGGSVNGTLTVGAGAVLEMNGQSMESVPVLKGGTVDFGGSSTLSLTGTNAEITMENQHLTLLGKGIVSSDDSLIVNSGVVTVNDFGDNEADIEVESGTLKLATGKKSSSNAIHVSGAAAVVNGATHYGDIVVDGVLTKETSIKLLSDDQCVELNCNGELLGSISGIGTVNVNLNATESIDATAAKITASHLNLNSGTFTNTKGIKLAKGQTLSLGGVTLNLGPKGALATAAGSTLAVSGSNTLSGSLTLGGGELVFEGGSLDVNGTLTLSKAVTVTGSGVISYTALKPFKGDIAVLFGGAKVVQEGNTLIITGAEPLVSRRAPAPLDAAPAPLDAAPAPLAMTPATNPVADAMVQADWGILDANRAFAGAVNTRHQHAALLDKGRGAAWVSAFGSSVRHGNKGAHHGSDGNIEGAAFGLEHAVSDTSTLGLAVGRSKNRLAATGVTHLRQETAHVALYGQKQLAHGFTADATAAYGDTETKLGSASWQQKSAALTARLTHAQQLTDASAFRTFGGLAYEATDAGNIGSAHTGSVQNLRAELGAGITHTAGKAHLYAEAALTGDLIRHNPTADLDGTRTHGANPGRIGLRATVGGLYEFTDTWSGTASYGIETESRSTSHTLNIGVSKSF